IPKSGNIIASVSSEVRFRPARPEPAGRVALGALVIRDMVTVVVGTADDPGLKLQVVAAGNPEQLRFTADVKDPIAVRLMVYIAVWPLLTDCGPVGEETEKSPTFRVIACCFERAEGTVALATMFSGYAPVATTPVVEIVRVTDWLALALN